MNRSSIPYKSQHRTGLVERTLVEINNALEQSIFADKLARQDGLLQGLDPRAKLTALLCLLLAVNLSRQIWVIAVLYGAALIMAAFSKISIRDLIQRVGFLVLVFTGLIALPALFITPGAELFRLPLGLIVTRTGALSATFLLSRVLTSTTYGVVLILTTPWNTLLKALGLLHLPDVIILTVGMTYRYIHLLLHLTNDMFLSRKSRLIRPLQPAEGRRLLAATIGTLLGKSLQLSGEVYLAMESRGFRGYPRTLEYSHMRRRDIFTILLAIITLIISIWFRR